VRTMAGDSRNLLQTLLDPVNTPRKAMYCNLSGCNPNQMEKGL
jgi:hypothetical protein